MKPTYFLLILVYTRAVASRIHPPERRHMEACIVMAAVAAAHCSRVPANRLRVISATVPVASVVTVP